MPKRVCIFVLADYALQSNQLGVMFILIQLLIYAIASFNLDDLTSYMMLKQILNLKLDSNDSSIAAFQNLNILKNAKDSLNSR